MLAGAWTSTVTATDCLPRGRRSISGRADSGWFAVAPGSELGEPSLGGAGGFPAEAPTGGSAWVLWTSGSSLARSPFLERSTGLGFNGEAESDDLPFSRVEAPFTGVFSPGSCPFGSLAGVGSSERESGTPGIVEGGISAGCNPAELPEEPSFSPLCPRATVAVDVANSIIPKINNSRRPMDSIPSLGAAPIDATPRE